MTVKRVCPIDGTELRHISDCGIVDYDGKWDAQTARFDCAGTPQHSILVLETDCMESEEAEDPAIIEALDTIHSSMASAEFDVTAGCVRLTSANGWTPSTQKSLEDLRSELAHRAVEAYKDNDDGYQSEEYEFLQALEDVDDVFEDYEDKLKEMGWVPKE